jgi:hypothetical protein
LGYDPFSVALALLYEEQAMVPEERTFNMKAKHSCDFCFPAPSGSAAAGRTQTASGVEDSDAIMDSPTQVFMRSVREVVREVYSVASS